jgi:hypothetical protein
MLSVLSYLSCSSLLLHFPCCTVPHEKLETGNPRNLNCPPKFKFQRAPAHGPRPIGLLLGTGSWDVHFPHHPPPSSSTNHYTAQPRPQTPDTRRGATALNLINISHNTTYNNNDTTSLSRPVQGSQGLSMYHPCNTATLT